MIASVSSLGSVHIWSTATADTWSAFAPGFEELEENHIYEEKEDEFDIVRSSSVYSSPPSTSLLTPAFSFSSRSVPQEDASSLLRRKRLEEDYPVDILSISPVLAPAPLPTHHPSPDHSMEVDSVQAQWWWEEEDDEDGKVDWFLPLHLDEEGRVTTGWESLF